MLVEFRLLFVSRFFADWNKINCAERRKSDGENACVNEFLFTAEANDADLQTQSTNV